MINVIPIAIRNNGVIYIGKAQRSQCSESTLSSIQYNMPYRRMIVWLLRHLIIANRPKPMKTNPKMLIQDLCVHLGSIVWILKVSLNQKILTDVNQP